jgi:uncharacterized paraquat-inducible protein A
MDRAFAAPMGDSGANKQDEDPPMKIDSQSDFGTRECPGCAVEVPANENRCPICGYEFPVRGALHRNLGWIAALVLAAFLLLLLGFR